MNEYGVFNSEGLIEGGFYSEEFANQALEDYINDGEDPDDIHIARICEYHEEQEADSCSECLETL